MDLLKSRLGFMCDMDGVLYHSDVLLPGVKEFVNWLYENDKKFLFLTNNSSKTPLELKLKLRDMGLDVDESHFYTSALATGKFISQQTHHPSAYVIGEPGLYAALYDAGVVITDKNPDYVVVGESLSYNFEQISKAVNLVREGSRLIGTNRDLTGPTPTGIIPACRALISPIEMAAEKEAYFIGKPNPLMMRTGLRKLGVHSEDAVMIGDRMDTDIVAGVESGLDTVLVLSGVTSREEIELYPYRPRLVLNGVGDIAK